MSTVTQRWTTKLAGRRALATAARKRYIDHPTAANRATYELRKRQVAFAERVLSRNRPITGVSKRGVNLIGGFEGCVLHPYQDVVGVWTIGYGHTEGVTSKTPGLKTRAQALALLEHDLDTKYAPPVLALKLPDQHKVDAVVSIVYNCGAGVVGPNATLGLHLRRGAWQVAADSFLLYKYAGGKVLPGLLGRRRRERAVFLYGYATA